MPSGAANCLFLFCKIKEDKAMYKIKNSSELMQVKSQLTGEVAKYCDNISKVQDECYKQEQDYNNLLYIVNDDNDIAEISAEYQCLNWQDYEFLDFIKEENCTTQIGILYILSANVSVTLIVPEFLIPVVVLEEYQSRMAV